VSRHRRASEVVANESEDLEFLDSAEFLGHFEDARVRSLLLGELVETRNAIRMTQAQIAAVMRTTQSAISELEGGATDPRLSTLQRYARAVGSELQAHLRVGGAYDIFSCYYKQVAEVLRPLGEAATALAPPAPVQIDALFTAVQKPELVFGEVPPVKAVKEVQVSDIWEEVA
jgi:transcriptional regulator with XRE-family HTH domain